MFSLGEFGHRAAVLPDVLADGHADARAVHVEHHGFVAGAENAEFVEHTIVGQKVLVVAGPNHAVMQYDESVAWLGCLAISADRADHHKQVAKPIGSQFGGKQLALFHADLRKVARRARSSMGYPVNVISGNTTTCAPC